MDNKPLEKQAENLVKSRLLRYSFKIHELSFDEEGADLYVTELLSKQRLKYLKIQCKGRRLNTATTSITIPSDYVTDNFILFIYTITENDKESLLVFFPNEIKEWKLNKKQQHVLSLTKNKLITDEFTRREFSEDIANKIKELLVKTEKKNTSIFIDGIFLQNAIHKTIYFYSSLYPEREFFEPNLNTIVEYILEYYDIFKNENNDIDCYLYLSSSFSLETIIIIDYDEMTFYSKNNSKVRIHINKANEFIFDEILTAIKKKSIEDDDILLVANDKAYEIDLFKLKEEGFDLVIVRYNEKDGRDMDSPFKWGNINNPLGRAIGLQIDEL